MRPSPRLLLGKRLGLGGFAQVHRLREVGLETHVEDRPEWMVGRPSAAVDEQIDAPRGGGLGRGHELGGRPSGLVSASLSRSLGRLTTPPGPDIPTATFTGRHP